MSRTSYQVRFQDLTAASMKMTVFWVVGPCSLVEVYIWEKVIKGRVYLR
jgi:hypothetical protein